MLKDLTWQFSVITVTIGFISNVIILINLTMKCLKVQRTRGSVFLALWIFYISAIDLWKAKGTITRPANLLRHNELFHLIKNLNNLTDESSNDDTNSLNVSNKYRDPEYFCNLPGNIKPIFHHNVCSLSKNFDQLHALLAKLEIRYRFINFIILLRATYIRPSWDNCQRLPRRLLKQIQRFVRLLHQKDCRCTAEVNYVFKLLPR